MMPITGQSSRVRQVIVITALAILSAASVLFYLTVLGGWLFFSVIIVTLALAALGFMHWLVLGRTTEQRVPAPIPRRHAPRRWQG